MTEAQAASDDRDPAFDYGGRHPLRVGAIIRLARRHRPALLAELGERLDRLGFVGRPGFLSVVRWGPNRPEESAMPGWLWRAPIAIPMLIKMTAIGRRPGSLTR